MNCSSLLHLFILSLSLSLPAATVHLETTSSGRDIACCFTSVLKTSGHEKSRYCGSNLLDKVRQGPQGCSCFHRGVLTSQRHKTRSYRYETLIDAEGLKKEKDVRDDETAYLSHTFATESGKKQAEDCLLVSKKHQYRSVARNPPSQLDDKPQRNPRVTTHQLGTTAVDLREFVKVVSFKTSKVKYFTALLQIL